MNLKKLKLKSLFKDEHAKFRIAIGLQFAFIPLLSLAVSIILNYIVLKVTLSVLSSFNSEKSFIVEDLLYLFAQKGLVDLVPWIVISTVALTFFGMFMGNVMLRPFRIIAEYCEGQLADEKKSYNPEFITELKLLSLFSEWFFHTITILKEAGGLTKIEVPEKYKRIHKPVFESNFFVNNFLVIIIMTLITAFLIYVGNAKMFEGVVEVIREIYSHEKSAGLYIQNISEVFDIISILSIGINIFIYFIYSFFLYSKVSAPAFGVFATMRSFINGRYSARVHLIGYSYLRNYTRMLNKYLDHVEKEYVSKDN
ncbi:MAG: hypothetical protein BM556_04420 [Bacteriovorax sp. MedPE-SWde]|mgnify:CR=1 FL=1|nr:MAG: hypothetical protein BM556_04420 [Bacteriovorax sp. MedPE-SWde]